MIASETQARRRCWRREAHWFLLCLVAGSCATGVALQAKPSASAPASATADTASAPIAPPPSPMQRMLQPGPEAQRLARQIGTWNVVMTLRPAPNATPIVTRDLVAERTMTGLYLNEVMKPAPGSKVPDFRRLDHLTYDAVQARWEYVSMDTRAPIGIMFAKSWANEQRPEISVYFENFADPGLGTFGASVRARHIDKLDGDNHHIKQQYWRRPGEPEWLAVQYDYTRRR
jgi:hypothetical protein